MRTFFPTSLTTLFLSFLVFIRGQESSNDTRPLCSGQSSSRFSYSVSQLLVGLHNKLLTEVVLGVAEHIYCATAVLHRRTVLNAFSHYHFSFFLPSLFCLYWSRKIKALRCVHGDSIFAECLLSTADSLRTTETRSPAAVIDKIKPFYSPKQKNKKKKTYKPGLWQTEFHNLIPFEIRDKNKI